MPIIEKIVQIYLTLVLSFLSLFKILIIAPFISQIKIESEFLVNLIDLIYRPAYLPGEILIYFTERSEMLIILTGFLAAMSYFILIIIESYFLAKLIIILGKSVLPKNIFGNAMASVKSKINVNNKIESSGKFESVKEYLPVAVFIVLLIILYPILTNFIKKDSKENIADKNKITLLEQANKIEENIDFDDDGLNDKTEFILGTDRYFADTDNDGFSDCDELKNGHNPFLISPQDKLSSEMQIEIQEVLFSGKEINFSRLEDIRNKLLKQVSEKLCQNDHSSYEDLSDKDKARDSIKLKNPCMCSKVIEIKDRNYCFSVLGATVNDESLCSYISEEGREERNGFYFKSIKDDCFRNLMSVTLDEKYCYKISKESRRTNCLTALILKTKRYNLCDSIKNINERDECYWTVAIFSKNTKLCNKISPNNKNGNCRESCRDLIKFPKF